MQDYHQLDIWHRSMDYAVSVYEFAADLPNEERYNLAAQLRRAVASVPLNIAEGAGCGTNAEFARFVGYAYRSLKEVITCIELCERIYRTIPRAALEKLVDEGTQISRMTHTFMQRL